MSTQYGFISILQQALDTRFTYDYEINWDKKNFAVEVSFLFELAQADQDEPILFEDGVIFYHPSKSRVNADDYLVALPYDPIKGLSAEFINYFADFLQETADRILDESMDFLESDQEDYSPEWDQTAFETGLAQFQQTTYHKYPRY